MAHAGLVIENPQAKETIRFVTCAADSAGEELVFDMVVGAATTGPPRHLHPHQQELFEVRAGRLRIRVGRETHELGPGESIMVPPGVPHSFAVAGDEELHMRSTFRPALDMEGMLEEIFGLAAAGRIHSGGVPHLLPFSSIAAAHLEDGALAGWPVWLQRVVFGGLARLARLLGRDPQAPVRSVAAG
jgi:quercetin dioxygenase-like cupin family protein